MKHNEYKQLIHLSLYGELNEDEKKKLKEHLDSCEECRMELEQQKNFLMMVTENQNFKVNNELLKEARAQLRGALRSEQMKGFSLISFGERVLRFFSSPPKLALGAVAILLIGFIFGGMFFSKKDVIVQTKKQQFTKTSLLQDNTRITNLQFVDSDLSDGSVEFTFDAVKRVNLSGKVNDPEIQNILTYAMLNEQNPGSRLNSINVMDTYGNLIPDNEIKDALITVVMTDENPGVRMEALKLISKFNYDESFKQAYLFVLLNDSSSALRIASLNALIKAAKSGYQLKQNDVELVMQKAKQDDNNYIRLKSKTLLKEYN
ncbi:MAG: zf-HC2 domain-containing protein [Ignavibacteria bacterium]|nr:zf-HC2 domain-containing protein [Ignavibacteria bacterium]